MVELIYRFSVLIALANTGSCLFLGFWLESSFGTNFVERMGGVSVGISVFVFGIAVSDLLNRGQAVDFSRIPHFDERVSDEARRNLGGTRSWNSVSRTLNEQAWAVLFGTLQASFGSIILRGLKC